MVYVHVFHSYFRGSIQRYMKRHRNLALKQKLQENRQLLTPLFLPESMLKMILDNAVL